MTKIINAKKKISRKLGVNLWGRANDSSIKKNYFPGQHGPAKKSRRLSNFGEQMRAKQMLKFYYNISEGQFKKLFIKATNQKGDRIQNFVGLLESRLDTLVYRANFVPTVFAARQFVNHKHVLVNGKSVNIRSYRLKPGDVVSVSNKAREMPMVIEALQNMEREVPSYLSLDAENFTIKFMEMPKYSDIPYDVEMKPELIVEYYSTRM